MRRGAAAAAALAALTLLLTLPWLGTRDLWNPNEPTYALAVAEMIDADEWLVPTVNGERFLEKPPLYFWLARLAVALFGLGAFALRLPAVLAAVGAVVAVYGIARELGDTTLARLSSLIFLSFVVVAQTARQIQMDLPLTATVALAIWAALVAIRTRRLLSWFGCGVAVGLGLLTKGPVALVAVGLPILLYLAESGREVAWRQRWGLLVASAATALVVAPWLISLQMAGELPILGEMFFRQSFTRFVDPWDHAQPWWYYLKYLWIDFAPWSWLLPAALLAAPMRSRLPWLWLLSWTLFVSLSVSKRSVYLLPAAPAIAFLVAVLLRQRLADQLRGWRRRWVDGWFCLLLALALFVAAATLTEAAQRLTPSVRAMVALGALLFVAVPLVRWWWRPGGVREGLASVTVCLLVAEFAIVALLLPQFNQAKSARPFAEQVRQWVEPETPLDGYRLWRWRADYPYYLERRLGRIEDESQLVAAWDDREPRCFIVEQGKRAEFVGAIGGAAGEPRVERKVGSKRVALWCNPAFESSAVGAHE